MMENEPSEAAVRVAGDRVFISGVLDEIAEAADENRLHERDAHDDSETVARMALATAHDPANFDDPLEASVNTRAVLEALWDYRETRKQPDERTVLTAAIEHLTRTLGGDRG